MLMQLMHLLIKEWYMQFSIHSQEKCFIQAMDHTGGTHKK